MRVIKLGYLLGYYFGLFFKVIGVIRVIFYGYV